MAMTTCKECKQAVSSKAKTCPNCGIAQPAVPAGSAALGFVMLAGIVWGAVAFLGGDDDASAAAQAKTPQEIAAEAAACRADLQCWGSKYNTAAAVRCDNHIEGLANYSHEWTDGLLDLKFSHFRWLDQPHGTVTYIGDKIKFQNGFGAWQNYVYECDYDPDGEAALAVRAEPGRL